MSMARYSSERTSGCFERSVELFLFLLAYRTYFPACKSTESMLRLYVKEDSANGKIGHYGKGIGLV